MELAVRTTELFDLTESLAGPYLSGFEYPWEALSGIGKLILDLGQTLSAAEYDQVGEDVWIAKTAEVFPSAFIKGPAIIGPGAEIRHCAFIRGNALVGAGAVVGNSTELKNVILFNRVQVPHYNYVGDSILGQGAHMGAGAITSNVKGDRLPIVVHAGEQSFETGLKKFGAMLGDNTEIGCQTVLNPGTIVGPGSRVYPLTLVRGVIPPDSLVKQDGRTCALIK